MKKLYVIYGIIVICCFWRFTSASMTQTVKFDKSDFKLYAEDKYDRISSDKYGTFGKEGEPELPGVSITLIIPTGQTVASIKIDTQDKEKIEGVFNIYPTQSPVPTSIHAEKPKWVDQDPGVYLSDEAYPLPIFNIVSEGYFDGATRLLTIKISPFQYLPLTGELWFTNQVTFTLNYAATKEPSFQPLKRSENVQKIYDGILRRIVYNTNDISTNQIRHVNNKNLSKGNAVQAGSCDSWEYTVITNETLAPYFSDFITFKKRRGMDIGLVTVEDIYDNYIGDQTSGIYDDAGKIRKYLTEAYSDHTVWVLLGGDDTVIPVRYGAAYSGTNNWSYIIPTDLYYAELNGDWNIDNDTYDPILAPPALQSQGRYGEPYPDDSPQYQSELFVGRLAVSTQSEIENWFDKYLSYCENPNNGDYTYLIKALVTQEDQMQHCNAEAQTLEQLFSQVYTTEIVEENAGSCLCNPHNSNPSFPLPSDVVSEINENYGLICFQNHGGPNLVSISTGEGYDDENPNYYHCHTWRPWYSLHDYRSTNGNQSGLNFLTNINAYSVIYTESCDVAAFDFFRNPNPDWLDILPEMTKTFMEAFIESEKKVLLFLLEILDMDGLMIPSTFSNYFLVLYLVVYTISLE